MMNLDYSNKWDKKCPQIQCRKDQCTGLQYVFIPATMGDDTKDSPVAPKNGAYCNSIVLYEATNAVYIYSKEGIPTKTSNGGYIFFNDIIDRPFYDNNMMTSSTNIPKVPENVSELTNDAEYQTAQEVADAVASEAYLREVADNGLQEQIDTIVASSDVKDIVGTYAELQAYDTSTLGMNDIIKVLQDETRDDAETYYRWNSLIQSFTYIGELGPFYTKAETDNLLDDKQDTLIAGDNIAISQNNTISAIIDDGIYVSTRRNVYIDGVSGSDSNDGATVSTPKKTIAGVFDLMNKVGGSIDVKFLSGGTYSFPGGFFDGANFVFEKNSNSVSDITMNLTSTVKMENSVFELNNINLSGSALDCYNSHLRFARTGSTPTAEISVAMNLYGTQAQISAYTLKQPITLSNGATMNLNVCIIAPNFSSGVPVKISSSSSATITNSLEVDEPTTAGLATLFQVGMGSLIFNDSATIINNVSTNKFSRAISSAASTIIMRNPISTALRAMATNDLYESDVVLVKRNTNLAGNENFTFTMVDGTTVVKKITLGA